MVRSRAVDRTYSRVRSVGFLMHLHRAVEHLSRRTAMVEFCILLKIGCESPDLSTIGGDAEIRVSAIIESLYLTLC
jgi:hypothetical protein